MSQLPSDGITAAPYLCVINETLRNPIPFEIPSTGVLLSLDSPPCATRAGGEVMKQEGMFHVLSINLFPALRHYWISRNFAKVRQECEKSSVVSFFVFSNFIRYFIWHSTNTLLNSRRREAGTEDEKFDSKAFFELHTSLCSLCLAPNFSSAILLQQRAGVTTEFSQSYVLKVGRRWKKTIHERQRSGEMNFFVRVDRPLGALLDSFVPESGF